MNRLLPLVLLLAGGCASAQPADSLAEALAALDRPAFYNDWDNAAGAVLLAHLDADGSGLLEARETEALTCEAFRVVQARYEAEYDRTEFWLGMGFAPGLMWNGVGLQIDPDEGRSAAWARIQACFPEAEPPEATLGTG